MKRKGAGRKKEKERKEEGIEEKEDREGERTEGRFNDNTYLASGL